MQTMPADRLARAMRLRKLTAADLAARSGVHADTIRRMLGGRGAVTDQSAQKVLAALGEVAVDPLAAEIYEDGKAPQ